MSAPKDFTNDSPTLVPGELTGYRAFYVSPIGSITSITVREFTWNVKWQTAQCDIIKVEGVTKEDESCDCLTLEVGNVISLFSSRQHDSSKLYSYPCRCKRRRGIISGVGSVPFRYDPENIKTVHYWGKKFHPDSHIPSQDCECGFYSAYSPEGLKGAPGLPNDPTLLRWNYVVGAVKASGRVLLGSKGFRAERMKVLGLVSGTGNQPVTDIPIWESLTDLMWQFPPQNVTELLG